MVITTTAINLADQERIWREDARRCKASFAYFLRQAWHVLEPSRPLIWGSHTDACTRHLQAVGDGEIHRLVANLPPAFGKSTMFSAAFPAWIWTRNPYEKFLCASYAMDLSIRDRRNCRVLLESEWYQNRFSDVFKMSSDVNMKSFYENDKRGFMQATATFASGTGKRCTTAIIDDPNNAMAGQAEVAATRDWFSKTWIPRLNDREHGTMLLVMQRLYADDLTAHVLELGGWEHLCLPMEFESVRKCYTSIGWEDPRTKEGELLCEELVDEKGVEELKHAQGSFHYSAQQNQAPVPSTGGTFKKEWARYFEISGNYYILHTKYGREKVVSIEACQRYAVCDPAISQRQSADFFVLQIWDVTPENEALLLAQLRDHFSNPDQQKKIVEWYERYLWMGLWVESVNYQAALFQQLKNYQQEIEVQSGLYQKRTISIPVKEWLPARGDKVARAGVAAIKMEAGDLYWLLHASYLTDLTPEIFTFPKSKKDDQCILPDAHLPYISYDDIMSKAISHRMKGDMVMLLGEARNLKEGDLVLTHEGKWQRIIRVITRHYQGEMVSIKPQGGFALSLTPEHPVYCVKRTGHGEFWKPRAVGEPKWIPASEVAVGDSVLEAIDQQVTPIDTLDLSEWLQASRFEALGRNSRTGLDQSRLIVEEDVIRFSNPRSHPIKRFVPVTGDFCRLLGYYVAEGSRGKHNVQWSFNAKEAEYINDVKTLIENIFGTSPSLYTQKNATTVAVSSLILHDFFAQFGRGAAHKMVPQWIMHLPAYLQREFLKGAWRGDGCVANGRRSLVYVSSSRELVMALRMMLYRLGIVPAISVSRPNGSSGHIIDGKTVKQASPLYDMRVGGTYAIELASMLGAQLSQEQIQGLPRTYDRIVDGYVHRRVRRIELMDYDGPVYNFEVEDDHSYQTESFLVHNCDCHSMICDILSNPQVPLAGDTEDNYGLGDLPQSDRVKAILAELAILDRAMEVS